MRSGSRSNTIWSRKLLDFHSLCQLHPKSSTNRVVNRNVKIWNANHRWLDQKARRSRSPTHTIFYLERKANHILGTRFSMRSCLNTNLSTISSATPKEVTKTISERNTLKKFSKTLVLFSHHLVDF